MNAKLREFLDHYGFEYEFRSATECYKSGEFDTTLLQVLAKCDKIMDVMLPTLGEERQSTYNPFLPICPETGRVLQVPIEAIDLANGTISYRNDRNELVTTKVTGGNCKLQWKPDWGMRWAHFNVDYEMHGKDLIPSAELSARISKIIANTAPLNYRYELFFR